jgi:hypothetical protein
MITRIAVPRYAESEMRSRHFSRQPDSCQETKRGDCVKYEEQYTRLHGVQVPQNGTSRRNKMAPKSHLRVQLQRQLHWQQERDKIQYSGSLCRHYVSGCAQVEFEWSLPGQIKSFILVFKVLDRCFLFRGCAIPCGAGYR